MTNENAINLIEQILIALGRGRPHADIRQVLANFGTTEDPRQKLIRCLDRLGINAKMVDKRFDEAVQLAGMKSGFLLVADERGPSESGFLVLRQNYLQIDAGAPGGAVQSLSKSAFAKAAGLSRDATVTWLQLEPRPTLRAARANPNQPTGLTPFRRLLGLLKPDRRDITIVILFAIGVGILNLATPIAVQSLVNFVAFGGLVQPLVVIAILLFAFLALAGAIRAFKTWVVDVLQRRIFVRVVGDLAYRLPRVRIDAFDARSGPELVNRFFDVLTIQKASQTILLDGVGLALQALIGLIILAFYHPFLLAFDVVLILCIVFILFVLGRGAVKTAIKESKAKYAVAASLEEIALHPMLFKQAGGADFAWFRADSLAAEYVHARRKHFAVVLRQIIGAVTLQALAATALLTLGGFLVINNQLTLGQLVAAELIVSAVLASLAKFGKQLESIYDLLAGVDKLGQLIDLPLERGDGEDVQSDGQPAGLALKDVKFAYQDGHKVFESLNLVVEPRQCVFVAGGQGSGKSTLADLLCGARTPSAGRIELDGIDIRELSLDALRRQVAVVKNLEIVEGTIADNVRLERSDITNEDVRRALQAVGLLDTVRALPDGLDTPLHASGRPLSYGHARRLMVARAIAARPRLMVLVDVLDELDASSRDVVVNSVMGPDRTWTLIATTHGNTPLPEPDLRVPLGPEATVTGNATAA